MRSWVSRNAPHSPPVLFALGVIAGSHPGGGAREKLGLRRIGNFASCREFSQV
jgi:hypothetical protein